MAEEIRGNALCTRLQETLQKYVSRVIATSILRQAFKMEKIEPLRLNKKDLEKIFESSIFVGVRTFCRPEELTRAMLDLAQLAE